MAFEPELYNVVNGVAGLLLAGLGAYVLSVPRRKRGNTAFGLFMVFFGLGYFLNHLFYTLDVPLPAFHWAAALPGWGTAAVLLLFVGSWFPEDVRRGQRAWSGAILALALATLAIVLAVQLPDIAYLWNEGAAGWAAALGYCSFFSLVVFLHAFLVYVAMRYGRSDDPRMRRRLAITGIAIGVYVASVAGSGPFTLGSSIFSDHGPDRAWSALNLAWAAWAATWWARNAVRERGGAPLVACVTLVGVTLLGLWVGYTGDVFLGMRGIFHGSARIVAFVILTYAILKDHLLGIDLRARTTVKASTYGAAGVAVFFVVSEGSASILSSRLGPMLGLSMAAVIVAAMVPLHSRIDRLAERAVPIGPGTDFYLEQARIAWQDGAMSFTERRMLDQLRERLGIPAEQATALEARALQAT